MAFRPGTESLPDFLLVGAAKSGTTYLFRCLAEHPKVFTPEVKEPGFLYASGMPVESLRRSIDPVPLNRIVTEESGYRDLFSAFGRTGAVAGEASTPYLYMYRRTIANIDRLYDRTDRSPRILIVLRNPVETAFSNYLMWRYRGKEQRTFQEAMRHSEELWRTGYHNRAYLHKYLYANQVRAYLERFPDARILWFDDLVTDPLDVIANVYKCIQVDASYIPPGIDHRVNPTVRTRKTLTSFFVYKRNSLTNPIKTLSQWLLPHAFRARLIEKLKIRDEVRDRLASQDRKRLVDFFSNDIEELQQITKRDLSAWMLESPLSDGRPAP